MVVPCEAVDGVGAVGNCTPPDAELYQCKVCPAKAVAERGTAVAFTQYVTGVVTTGTAGFGLTVIVNEFILVQPFNVAVTVIVAIIALAVELAAVKTGIVPLPLAAKPIPVLLLVHVNTAPAGLLVKA